MIDERAIEAASQAYQRVLGILHKQASRAALEAALPFLIGEGWVVVPKEPPVELLVSMAIREDHGLGVPGYYDQAIFGESQQPTHARRMEVAIDTMRKLYEEVIGDGFYSPERADFYRERLPAAPDFRAAPEEAEQ